MTEIFYGIVNQMWNLDFVRKKMSKMPFGIKIGSMKKLGSLFLIVCLCSKETKNEQKVKEFEESLI